MYAKVKDRKDLVRDMSTKAILAVDHTLISRHEQYMAQKKKKLGWKLNKEQKSVHAVKSYLYQLKSNIHTKNMP